MLDSSYLPRLLIVLHCPVAAEVFLERLTYPLDVEVVGKTGDGRYALTTVTLLDADVDLVVRGGGGALGGVLEGVETRRGRRGRGREGGGRKGRINKRTERVR